jgi:hypothetical protein
MGQQTFGRILWLIFLSTKKNDNVQRNKKTATQNIFKAPQKMTAMQNKALIFCH